MLGRMQRSADFERVLATPARARSAHFAAHHVAQAPSRPSAGAAGAAGALTTELSTGDQEACAQPVDESASTAPERCWFGAVVPKRHARKAATRNLLRRQIRAAMDRHHAGLPRGLWLVRLRAPFDARRFPSAASAAMRAAARHELDALLTRAAE
jgi:ribonuclease P protein component